MSNSYFYLNIKLNFYVLYLLGFLRTSLRSLYSVGIRNATPLGTPADVGLIRAQPPPGSRGVLPPRKGGALGRRLSGIGAPPAPNLKFISGPLKTYLFMYFYLLGINFI